MKFLDKFKKGIDKSSSYLKKNIERIVLNNKIDEKILNEIEDLLITADLGTKVSKKLVNKLRYEGAKKDIKLKDLQLLLAEEIEKILLTKENSLDLEIIKRPEVYIFVGVNGSGKTTSIGKLAKQLSLKNKVMIAACDTFRAAAVDQIREWSNISKIDLYEGKANQDPASVAFQASEKAKLENYDILLVDTAGRLSNNRDLMNQLSKIKKVINKSLDNEIKYTFLVLDASTGSNIMNQFESFNSIIGINGLIITKLDGTAKGGALVSVALEYDIPIYFIGLGEGIDDLYPFKAKEFSLSLFNLINEK